MKDDLADGTGDCPYCRLPGGRVRVPRADEQRRFCLPGQWRDCSVYQRHAATG